MASNEGGEGDKRMSDSYITPKIKSPVFEEREDFLTSSRTSNNNSPKPVPKPRTRSTIKTPPTATSPTKPKPSPRVRSSGASSANSSFSEYDKSSTSAVVSPLFDTNLELNTSKSAVTNLELNKNEDDINCTHSTTTHSLSPEYANDGSFSIYANEPSNLSIPKCHSNNLIPSDVIEPTPTELHFPATYVNETTKTINIVPGMDSESPTLYANDPKTISSTFVDDNKPEKLSDFIKNLQIEHDKETEQRARESAEADKLLQGRETITKENISLALDQNDNKSASNITSHGSALSMYINSLGSDTFPDADTFEQMIDANLGKQNQKTVPMVDIGTKDVSNLSLVMEPTKALDQQTDIDDDVYETIWTHKKKTEISKGSTDILKEDLNNLVFSQNWDSTDTLKFVPNKSTKTDENVPPIPEKMKPDVWGEYACLDPHAQYVSPPPPFAPPPLPRRSPMPSEAPPPLPPVPAPQTSFQIQFINAPPVPPRPLHETSKAKSCSPIPEPINIPSSINSMSELPSSSVLHEPVKKQESDVFKGFQTPKLDQFQEDPFKYSEFAEECKTFNTVSTDPQSGSLMSDSFLTSSSDLFGVSYPDIDKSSAKFDPFGINEDNSSNQSEEWFNRISLSNVPPPPSSRRATPTNLALEFALEKDAFDLEEQSNCSDTDSEEPYTCNSDQRVPTITKNTATPKNERCGYLYKQGGVNANKGWRKRWVVFNGTDLRYYVTNKSQISKRIIPINCVRDVVNDVKSDDTSRFKFKLITSIKDRIFHFAADDLDDCLTWSQTIMAAIYQRSGSIPANPVSLENRTSDKEGFIKFENGRGKKYFVTISESRLCYYHNKDDYLLNSPIHEILMKLASVKDSSSGKNRLQLSTHYGHFMLGFDNSAECQQWKMAMEDAIAEGLADDSVLEKIYENESNKFCADCDTTDPHWASINLGIVVCKKCAGIHRMFEYTVSKIRSLRMDTRVWTPSLIELMKAIGNANANNFWESELIPDQKIKPDATSEQRKCFIQSKYKYKQYCCLHQAHQDKNILNQELLKSAGSDNVLQTMAIVFSGADVLYRDYREDKTAYQLAKRVGERLQVEFLYQNCGDETTLATGYEDDGRLREDVRHQGYLMKTGPNFKGFDRRWCILEHGALTYYDSERSTTAKDSIERKNISVIQATTVDKQQAMFEISTSKNNQRLYLFAADNDSERRLWLQAIAKLICPINVMDHVGMMEFSLAGNYYIKDSVAEEWRKTWIMLNWRIMYYLNKEVKLESVDLRKASSIKHQGSETGCHTTIETGHHFVVNSPGRALYIQADLGRDTETLRIEMEKAIKGSGATLEDQQLTSDNVPVIVDKCLNYITNNGIKSRGIYRESATNSRVQLLLQELKNDPRSVRLEEFTDHEVANAVKRFFRGLVSSVFSQDYIQWMQTAAIGETKNKLAWYSYLLDRMPEIHFSTLKKIVMHLYKVGQNTSDNQMTIESLATCFAPSLLIPDASEIPSNIQYNLPRQLAVIMDIIIYYDSLFRLDQEKSIEDKMDEAERKIKNIEASPRMSMAADKLLIPISKYQCDEDCEMVEITARNTAAEVVDYFYNKRLVSQRNFNLHEILFKGELERPIHWSNQVFLDVCRWGEWSEEIRKGVCLCLKANDLMIKINSSYDPSKYLLSELKYSEKKTFKKMTFDFKQSKFSCYKDSKASNCMWSINAEDMILYLGVDPRRSSIPSKHGFTFLSKHENPPKTGYFGKSVCFNTQEDLYKWISAILMAQYPEGLLY